jgi:hypothetical protein
MNGNVKPQWVWFENRFFQGGGGYVFDGFSGEGSGYVLLDSAAARGRLIVMWKLHSVAESKLA